MKKTLLAAATLALAAATPCWAEDAAGNWLGLVNGQKYAFVHIEKTGERYAGWAEGHASPPNNASTFHIPLDAVTSNGDHLSFSLPNVGTYAAVWDKDLKAWTGRFTPAAGPGLDLPLSRAAGNALGDARLPRPQEEAMAANPAPHTDIEVSFDNPAAPGVRLAGTLSVPPGTGPFPAILLIGGQGRLARETELAGHREYPLLADSFNRQGIAVLRYDKRGVGQSTGTYAGATTGDFTSDAAAAFAFLHSRSEIDPKHVGVLGHSEGGRIAPVLAADNSQVAFVVAIAGPSLRGDKVFLASAIVDARSRGVDTETRGFKAAADLHRMAYDQVIASTSPEDAKARLQAFAAPYVAKGALTQREVDQQITAFTAPWMYYALRDDPTAKFKSIRQPILVINGALDVNVSARENLAAWRDDLKENKDATVVELPGLNHLLQTAKTGATSEFGVIEETMAPSALKLITDWVAAHSK